MSCSSDSISRSYRYIYGSLCLLLIVMISCNSRNNPPSHTKAVLTVKHDSVQVTSAVPDTIGGNTESGDTTEIICDSVYAGKGYKLSLYRFDPEENWGEKPTALFLLYKRINGRYTLIFSDSICNTMPEVKFEDFNNDGIKDILVQDFADVRSNLGYHLYLVDTAADKLKRIKGFEEIKNPEYLPEYDLVDNYVMSGQDWTGFYKIQTDSVKDYGIVIYDNHKDDTYRKDFKKAIRKIQLSEKRNNPVR
ncbi:XAC2610-related protein [Chitinophagaceae bacterium MMS25-I14]